MDTEHQPEQAAQPDRAQRFWERHYREHRRMWSGRPNPVLAEVAAALPAGTALDLGSGEGGDAVWLAGLGWRVTAVDVAPTALDRVRELAAEHGVADRVRTERHDLARSLPAGRFDLISAQYLHTPVELPRARVLRAAADRLAPGGLLLVVDHGSVRPWSWDIGQTHFPMPAEVFAELDLDPVRWRAERLDRPRREAVGPSGRTALVTDNVLAVRRAHSDLEGVGLPW